MSDESLEAREIAHEQEFVNGVYAQLQRSAQFAKTLAREGHERGRLG